MSFADKAVLVTGAGSGIGAAAAIAFAPKGAKVVMVDKDETRLKNAGMKCEIGCNKPLIINGDVSVEEDVKRIIKRTIKTCKRLDVLINSAGIFNFTNVFQDNLMDTFDETMKINLRAVVHLTKLAVPYLIQSKGNIVNISSIIVSSVPKDNFLCYGMSKAGLNYFSLHLAKELGGHGVRVNTVSPGAVRMNIVAHMELDNWWDQMESLSLLGRESEPEEIAALILFIAKSDGIHGSNYDM